MVLQAFFQGQVLATSMLGSQFKDVSMPAMTAGVLLLSLGLLWTCFQAHRKSDASPPGSRKIHRLKSTLPILGNTLDVIHTRPYRHDWYASLAEEFNNEPFMLDCIGRPKIVFFSTVAQFDEVLRTKFDNFPKGEMQCDTLRDILGDGIFAVDHAKWAVQRKTGSNLFTVRFIRESMTDVMCKHTRTLRGMLERASEHGQPLDFFALMGRFTIEVFAEVGFGIQMNCLESEEEHPFQTAIDRANRIIMRRFQLPAWLWRLQRALNIGPEAQLKKDIQVMDKTVFDIIAQCLAYRAEHPEEATEEGGAGQRNLVSIFLDRFDKNAENAGQSFDPVYLRDVVINFLIAGRDTTAQALSWFFYNIHSHPEVVHKMRDELSRVMPEVMDGSAITPSLEQVHQLTYMEAVLKESLRLHPAVPTSPRHVQEDIVLSDGTFLRKGMMVALPQYALARMTSVWGPDAKQFNPERWIDPVTGKIISVSASKFTAFNAGPRLCLGMNMAMVEMKVVVSSILSHLDVVLEPGQHITYDNSVTLPMRGEMLVRIKKKC